MQPVNLATVAIVVPVLVADALSATLVPARRQPGRSSERTSSGVIVGPAVIPPFERVAQHGKRDHVVIIVDRLLPISR
jgi:hypothetical protein